MNHLTETPGPIDRASLAEELANEYRNSSQYHFLAFRILGNSEDAAECVQDAFQQAFAQLDSFAGQSKLSTWVSAIVKYRALNIRQTKSRRTPHLELDTNVSVAQHQAYSPRIDEIIIGHRQRILLVELVDKLKPKYAEVIMLLLEGLSYDEIATRLEINVGTVKSRLNRAKASLKEAATEFQTEL